MSHKIIAEYYYYYGSGSEPNRHIEFFRKDSDDPTSLEAQVSGQREGSWKLSSSVKARQIFVDECNTTQKAQKIMLARQQQQDMVDFPPEPKPIDQFTLIAQDNILESLAPRGVRKIEIENNFDGENNFEGVEKMFIFDPS